jgi:hypothetical protein
MTLGILSTSRLFAPAIALFLTFQDPVRTDATPPNPDDFVVGTKLLALYESDSGGCRKFDLRNVDANANSLQEIIITWQGDSGQPDTWTSCEIWSSQHVIRECHIKRIQVREKNANVGSSTHRMSQLKL